MSLESPNKLKVWAAGIVGAMVSASIIILGEIGSGEVIADAGKKFGYALGMGIPTGLVIWLVLYFAILRPASRPAKILSFLACAGAATVATFTQIG